MPKIALIGAGSVTFARRLITDILSFPELRDAEIALMDVDAERLEGTRRVAERIAAQGGYAPRITATQDRREALRGSDYVIAAILVGGLEAIRQDIEIPLRYGVDQCIGDTLGPGGVFRALRTIPAMLAIARDMEALCPDAWLLNYANPMAMLCWAIDAATPVRAVGLCHSVQGTAAMLAGWIGAPLEEIDHWVAGINHQAWFLQFRWRGEDAYPRIRERAEDPAIYATETTRCELLKHLGYFVTESSGHNSEYVPWIRKRPDLVDRYTPGGGWNGGTGFVLDLYGEEREREREELERIASGEEPVSLERSTEYGACVIHSLETGLARRVNASVRNDGLIENLPRGACVEVPCLVDRHGISPCAVGELPPHLAAINRSGIAVQELAVQAALQADRRLAFHAVSMDPLTAAVLSLEEIEQMVDEMFEAEARWLPPFART